MLLLAALAGSALGMYSTCPGAAYAAANIHTVAQMQVTFKNSCAEVAAEVEARAGGANGWTDPHNDGHYQLLGSTSSMIKTQRQTRRRRYTDKQTFALSATSDGGCVANICSESQGTSANDGGTNLCDMFDLFCNSSEKNPDNGVACKPVKTNLQYTIDSQQCGRYVFENIYRSHPCQNKLTTCLKVESEAVEAATLESVELGKYRTCPGSANSAFNIHTMAQMQVDFTNSCEEVAAEIEARAGMANGWKDPHNGGHYSLLSANANMIETKRETRRRKYTDKQTFSLQANGSGCSAYMCSESQGTSANDGGTNLCDMYNLFCNSSEKNPKTGVACKPIKYNLQYTIEQEDCGNYVGPNYFGHQCQAANPTCLKTATMSSVARLEKAEESPLCWLTNEACDLVLDSAKIVSAGACTGLNAAAHEACKVFGGPFTPLCEKQTAILETACKQSIVETGSFAAGECKKLIADDFDGCNEKAPKREKESPLCWLTNEACDLVLDSAKILSAGACTGLNAAAVEACKVFGGKLAPLCEKQMAIFETACKQSIVANGEFGAGECKKLIAEDFDGCDEKAPKRFALE